MIRKAELQQVLSKLGLSQSDICIHASLRSMGDEVEGGAQGITEVFLERGCTLMVPAFSNGYLVRPVERYMPSRNGVGDYAQFLNQHWGEPKLFSRESRDISADEMGVLAQYILQTPGSVRGNHPLNSFAALGPNAKALLGGQTPRDVYAPFRALRDRDGFVLLAGVTLNRATIIHCAEQLAGRQLFVRWARGADGKTIPAAVGGCSRGFDRLCAPLAPFMQHAEVGRSVWTLCRAQDMLRVCVEEIRANPRITHCGDPLCNRCNDAVLGGPVFDEAFWDS